VAEAFRGGWRWSAGFEAFFEFTHRHLGIYKIVLRLSSCLAGDGDSVQSPSSHAGGLALREILAGYLRKAL